MHLDFITFSFPHNERFHSGLPKHDAFIFDEHQPCRPLPRYAKAYRLACGGIYCLPHENNAGQKRLIQMTGQECTKAREMGLDDDLALHLIAQEKGTPTRLDCAFDTDNPNAQVQHFITAFETGKMRTKVRTMEVSKTIGRKGEPANTAYLGTRESDAQLVVYDKAKQLKLLNQAWVRVEYRAYKNSAYRLMQDALEHGIDTVARQRVRNMQRTNIKWLNDMIEGADVELTMREEKENFWKWLDGQVAHAIDNRVINVVEDHADIRLWLKGRLNFLNAHDKNRIDPVSLDETELEE